MNPGELNKIIDIKTQSTALENTCGEEVSGYITLATPWAKIDPKGEGKYHIKIRYRKGIEKGMRVSWAESELEIKDIINPQIKNKELILMCEEVKVCQSSI